MGSRGSKPRPPATAEEWVEAELGTEYPAECGSSSGEKRVYRFLLPGATDCIWVSRFSGGHKESYSDGPTNAWVTFELAFAPVKVVLPDGWRGAELQLSITQDKAAPTEPGGPLGERPVMYGWASLEEPFPPGYEIALRPGAGGGCFVVRRALPERRDYSGEDAL